MEFCSDFRTDLIFGNEFETELGRIFNNKNVECKDESRKWKETGNMFFEIESYNRDGGLKHTQSDYWAEKLSNDLIIIIKTDKLKELLPKLYDKEWATIIKGGDKNTSKGYLINTLRLINGLRGV